MISRRALLVSGAAAGVVSLAPSAIGKVPTSVDTLPASAPVRRMTLTAKEIETHLLGADQPATRGVCAYDGEPFKIVRAPRGTRLMVDFRNELADPTTVHWHGIRVPFLSDGVAPLTQEVVLPGGTFSYNVPLPDSGLYFFHPHCDETGQVGRGLFALLVVDDPREERLDFQTECFLIVKDWRLGADAQWLAMSTPEGASTAGTFGTVRATNGQVIAPTVEAPAHSDVRVRAIIADPTRVIDLGCDTEEAALIATDGQSLPPRLMDTLPDAVWRMGPAMRADLHVRMPGPGQEVKLYDYRTHPPYLLTTLKAVDHGKVKTPFRPKALTPPTAPQPDVTKAKKLDFLIQTAAGPTSVSPALPPDDPLAKALVNSLCVGEKTYWAINRESWATGEALRLPPPLNQLTSGTSYILSMTNVSKHVHPMHLHGHVFRVLSSSKKKDLPHFLGDTVLVEPNETVQVAFKAVSGNWVFHCHILEHMDTGLMGWFRIV